MSMMLYSYVEGRANSEMLVRENMKAAEEDKLQEDELLAQMA